jgi:hypothetical protein
MAAHCVISLMLLNCTLKMLRMAYFILCIFYHNLKIMKEKRSIIYISHNYNV